MYHYDVANNLLEISKLPITRTEHAYRPSEQFESYKRYLEENLEEDVRKELLSRLLEVIGDGMYWLADEKPIEVKRVEGDYRGQDYYSVQVKLESYETRKMHSAKAFSMFQLPVMDETGILYRNGKRYAVAGEMVQSDTATFDPGSNSLRINCDKMYLKFGPTTKQGKLPVLLEPKMDKSRPLTILLAALAKQEGLDVMELIRKLRIPGFRKRYEGRQGEENQLVDFELEVTALGTEGSLKKYNTKSVMEALMSPDYTLKKVRNQLNQLLSIDRAEGRVLSRAVYLAEGKKLEAGTVVTSTVLKQMKRSHVNEVFVRNVPNHTGMYVAAAFPLDGIRRGTKLLPIFRELFADQLEGVEGDYAPRDYYTPMAWIPKGLLVEDGLLEALAYNNKKSVRLRKNENSSVSEEIFFEEEIIGNRCVLKRDCSENKEGYYYKKEDGTLVEPPEHLTAYDVLAIMSLLSRLMGGEDLSYVPNCDLGLRKRVKLCGDVFHEAIGKIATSGLRKVSAKLSALARSAGGLLFEDYAAEVENACRELSEAWWKEVYKTRLLRPLELTNPVKMYSELTKIESIVSDQNSISMSMRSQSLGHYGRLCPYESPQSKKLGVVNNKVIGCRIVDGVMKTSYYRLVRMPGNEARYKIIREPVWLSVDEEELYNIADLTSLDITSDWEVRTRGRVLARVRSDGLEKMSIEYIDMKYIDYVNTDPNQTIGYAVSTIPFVGADDSARVTFETSMVKQAKLLVDPDVPLVMTSANVELPRVSPFWQVNAEGDGMVMRAENARLDVLYDGSLSPKVYSLPAEEFTTDAVIIRKIEVRENQRVKTGDVLISSNATKEGYMAIGVNALIGYIPKGFNYEDGVFASARLQHKLTSYGAHTQKEEMPQDFSYFVFRQGAQPRKYKYLEKGKPICQIRKHMIWNKASRVVNAVIKSERATGFFHAMESVPDAFGGATTLIVNSVSLDPLNAGDKLANRHGNKGVTPRLRSNTEMPMFQNGEFLDLCYNPTGVTSRMNIGQILEANLGFACLVLGIRVRSDSYNGAQAADIKRLLSYAWHLANDSDMGAAIKMFPELPEELHEHSRQNITTIRNWAGCFNKDGTARLFNPRTNQYYETPVVVGVNYVYKLVHEASKKVHARGGYIDSRYVEKTDSPPKGASNDGGQRSGNMEIDALLAHGATNYLYELMNGRGDNAVARSNLTARAMHNIAETKCLVDEGYGMRRSVMQFVNTFAALGLELEFTDHELPNDTRADMAHMEYYTERGLSSPESLLEDESGLSQAVMKDALDAL